MNFVGGTWTLLLAQVNQNARMSYAEWVAQTLGIPGAVACFLGLAIFVGACFVVAKHRRPPLLAAYLLLAPVPLALAVSHVVEGTAISFASASMGGAVLTQSDFLSGLSESLLMILAGFWASLPAYLVIAGGLLHCAYRSASPVGRAPAAEAMPARA